MCKYGPEVDSIEPRSSLHGKMSQNGAHRLSPKLAEIPSDHYRAMQRNRTSSQEWMHSRAIVLNHKVSVQVACKRKSVIVTEPNFPR